MSFIRNLLLGLIFWGVVLFAFETFLGMTSPIDSTMEEPETQQQVKHADYSKVFAAWTRRHWAKQCLSGES